MERDIVIYDGKNFIRYPDAPRQADRRYFKAWVKINGQKKKTTLHRYKWIKEICTPIPKGYDIHHIDENYLNNDCSNFELKEHGKHISDHMNARTDEQKARTTNILITVAQEAAKEWHGSDAGLKWHSQHGKKNFTVQPTERICVRCKKTFIQTHLSHTTYCSPKCSNAYRAMIHRQRYPKQKTEK